MRICNCVRICICIYVMAVECQASTIFTIVRFPGGQSTQTHWARTMGLKDII